MKITHIIGGINVVPMQCALAAHPELWGANPERTLGESPHREIQDIWARYALPPFKDGPHESVWYPAARVLPVRHIAMDLMNFTGGERLGGILITRVPAGKRVHPHIDMGWHAGYYKKFAVQIASAPGQSYGFEGESLEPKPGDLYTFDNSYLHWVDNPTEFDRITMIVCIKTEKEYLCHSQP